MSPWVIEAAGQVEFWLTSMGTVCILAWTAAGGHWLRGRIGYLVSTANVCPHRQCNGGLIVVFDIGKSGEFVDCKNHGKVSQIFVDGEFESISNSACILGPSLNI